jgi:hypothetical protein
MSQESDRWFQTLSKLEATNPPLGQSVRNFWEELSTKFPLGSVPIPIASCSRENIHIIIWENPQHYLDVEINSTNEYAWFYRNRSSLNTEINRGDISSVVNLVNNFT